MAQMPKVKKEIEVSHFCLDCSYAIFSDSQIELVLQNNKLVKLEKKLEVGWCDSTQIDFLMT